MCAAMKCSNWIKITEALQQINLISYLIQLYEGIFFSRFLFLKCEKDDGVTLLICLNWRVVFITSDVLHEAEQVIAISHPTRSIALHLHLEDL